MLNILFVLLGLLIWGWVMADFVMTTVSAQGQGRTSRWIAERLWDGALAVLRRWDGRRVRAVIGPIILTLIGGFWIFGTWAAWMLLFSGTNSLQITTSNEPSDVLGTFVYTGSSLSTAGSSQIEVAGLLGGALTVLAAVNGMVVLTLTVSFILNLIQTIQSGRAFSLRVSSAERLGELDKPSAFSDFTDVATELNVNVLALYFAPPRSDMSLADALIHFAGMAREDESGCAPFERRLLDKGLSILPLTHTAAGELPDEDMLATWRDRYGTDREAGSVARTGADGAGRPRHA